MQKLMGDEGWGGGGLFFSTDPKCLWRMVRNMDGANLWNRITSKLTTFPPELNEFDQMHDSGFNYNNI